MSKFQPNWFYRHCLAAGLLSLVSLNSQAELVLEEVIVTAEKKEESLQETPIAITTMSGNEMKQLGITQTNQVADFAPNMVAPRTPSSNSAVSFAIRGVGSSETSMAKDSNVGIYIDGVTMGRINSAAMNIVDIERIEVLRGPQGTLYGRNTTGGAVNIVSKKPTGELGFKQSFTVGNYGKFTSTTGIDLPEIGGFSTKINYMYNENDSYFENTAPGSEKYLGSDETQAARINVTWTNDNNLSASFAYDINQREGTARPFQLVHIDPRITNIQTATRLDLLDYTPSGTPKFLGITPINYAEAAATASFKRQRYFNLPGDKTNENNSSGAHLTLNWDLNDNLTLKSISAYRELDITDNGSNLSGGDFGDPLFLATGEKNQHQISQEIQLLGNINDDIEYITGVFYFTEKAAEKNPQQFINIVPSLLFTPNIGSYNALALKAPLFQYTTDNKSQAIFGQITKHATSDLDVTVGLRYTKDERATTLYNPPFLFQEEQASDDWDDITGMFVVDYQFNEDVNTYFKYASGYNGGGYNIRATSAEKFKKPYDQEELSSYEVGLKAQLFDRRVRFNAAVFYNDYTDIQVTRFSASGGGASNEIVNAGSATVSGVEFEVTALLSENWRYQASYGHTDFRFNEYQINKINGLNQRGQPTFEAESTNIAGLAMAPRSPRHTATNSIIYENQANYGLWTARLDQSFTSKMVYDALARYNVNAKSKNLINARFGLSEVSVGKGTLSASLWGKNLTDEETIEWGIDFGSFGFAGGNFIDPKTFGLDLVYEF